MSRFITCVVKGSSKTVKVYDAEDFTDAVHQLQEENEESFKLKYIRNINGVEYRPYYEIPDANRTRFL